ncbi:hypothetical protein BC938DRAFT_473818 [Jimgerdemannia flammicorona]|uniref:Uncharacterized protein n=1 Tax=Jimgerdemannia flammicorona TaxID=994334 RepID=A0A433Q3A0_9FUNG|nr:hypothetical protein BC938DRAFT_473818 [Jimgerdemannia flammicorona]
MDKKLFDRAATSYFQETSFIHWSLTGFLMAVKPFWDTAVLSKEFLSILKKRYLAILNNIIADENRDKDQRNMAAFLAKQVLRFISLSPVS